MTGVELRKPTPPSGYESLGYERRIATASAAGEAVKVLIAGSGLFVFAAAFLAPKVPTWLVPTSPQDSERVAIMYVLVIIVEWTSLAVATAPVVLVLAALDRLSVSPALRNATDGTRRRTYGVIALLALAAAIPIWFLTWERAMLPIMESLVAKVALFGLLFVLGLYSLKNIRSVD